MKRKFSFDIPKLKFGPSKQETQALKQHLAARRSFDSEPPTPKSVRPPLPSITEAELKAACTWVVANYRPSHIPYQQAVGIGVSTQPAQHVDYAAINAAVRRENRGEAAPEPVQSPSAFQHQVRMEQRDNQWPSSDMFRYKPTESSADVCKRDELEVMREQRSSIMAKADDLMANLHETQKVLLSPEIKLHSRTTSDRSNLSLPLREAGEPNKQTLRSDSLGTLSSTPRTDMTGGAWPDSTPATSAYVTPATQSKRTSSHIQPDPHSLPKVPTPVDAEWMRQELEKHLKSQEEVSVRQESPTEDIVPGLAETTALPVAEIPLSPSVNQKKTMPRRGTGESQNFSLRTDSRQSKTQSRIFSYPVSMPTSPFDVPVPERPSTSGRISETASKRASWGRSVTQDSQSAARPGTARTTVHAEEPLHLPRSRAQSVKGHVQNFSRVSMDATSRRVSPGPEFSHHRRRSRSAESFRSAVSSISSSDESNAKPWRRSLGRRKSQDSDISMDSLGTRVSEASRGRLRTPRRSPPPPPIHVNNDVPPLPPTDKWKPIPAESSPPVPRVPVESKSIYEPKQDPHAYPHRQDSLVNRRPTQPFHRSIPSSPTLPNARHTIYFDAQPSPLLNSPLAPANTREPAVSPGLSIQSRERHRRSLCLMEAASPGLVDSMSQVSLGQVSGEQRPSPRPLTSTTHAAEKRHSRNLSGGLDAPNFSRKFSSDDYSRMYDSRYQNMLEVTPSQSHGSASSGGGSNRASTAPTKDKKRHWWQGKPKREETWMDAVIKSGSRSGVMLKDDVAGAPIVRY